jgi:NADPH-dependent ferric siderophore reductase
MNRPRPNRPLPKTTVVETAQLTPHMVRIIVKGPELDGFVVGEFTDHYVKCRFGESRLRRHLLLERGIAQDDLSATGYWKLKRTDEQWRAEKRDWTAEAEADVPTHQQASPRMRLLADHDGLVDAD